MDRDEFRKQLENQLWQKGWSKSEGLWRDPQNYTGKRPGMHIMEAAKQAGLVSQDCYCMETSHADVCDVCRETFLITDPDPEPVKTRKRSPR